MLKILFTLYWEEQSIIYFHTLCKKPVKLYFDITKLLCLYGKCTNIMESIFTPQQKFEFKIGCQLSFNYVFQRLHRYCCKVLATKRESSSASPSLRPRTRTFCRGLFYTRTYTAASSARRGRSRLRSPSTGA